VPLLVRASLRWLGRHPGQLALAVAGVALGVAVVVSIDLANASATRAFELSTETVAGRATHRVTGGPGGLPEEVFRQLTVELGLERAAPVVEGFATVDAAAPGGGTAGGARVLRLLGVDLLSEGAFRPWLAGVGSGAGPAVPGEDFGDFLTRPRAVLLSAATARDLGVGPGDELAVRLAASRARLAVLGVIEPRDELSRQALADLAVLDVAAAQELLGMVGRLSRVDLILPDGDAGDAAAARVRAALPPGARLAPAGARERTTRQMTRAFRLNLVALSLLALLCGLFLIYNAITFSVVQRRTLLGTLRTLGVTRRQVFALVLGEAAALGVVGTAAGLALGVVLGRGMVDLVTRTLNDLYFVLSVRELTVAPASLAKGALLGLGATLAAAWVPAREATAVPPRSALLRSQLESGTRRALPRVTAGAAALLALGAALLLAPTHALLPAFAGLFAVILGFALLAPVATIGLMRLLGPAAGRLFGILGTMAARGVVASLSRTAVAIAALAVAVSVTVGVGVMVDSFRGTVERWLAGALSADVYASPAFAAGGAVAYDSAPLPPELEARFAAVPGVAAVRTVRRTELAAGDEEPTRLVAIGMERGGLDDLEILEGEPDAAWRSFRAGGLIVSEPYAYHRRLGVGDAVELPTPAGVRAFPVAAVYVSYTSDRGVALISRRVFERVWGDRALSGLSVTLAPGATAAAVIPRLREAAGPEHALLFQSSRALREASLEVFDRTFLITGVLRLLAGLVAFIGVVSALMALQLERARELGVLRANGLTPRQVWRLVTAQTGLMGLAAGLLSLPVGLVLAAVMIFIINRRSFGWSLHMAVDPAILGEAVLLALAAALLAGVYPAWRMSRTAPAVALREE
jgi:putative ABC transport system permease protein